MSESVCIRDRDKSARGVRVFEDGSISTRAAAGAAIAQVEVTNAAVVPTQRIDKLSESIDGLPIILGSDLKLIHESSLGEVDLAIITFVNTSVSAGTVIVRMTDGLTPTDFEIIIAAGQVSSFSAVASNGTQILARRKSSDPISAFGSVLRAGETS